MNKKRIPFNDFGILIDGRSNKYLSVSYKKLGLRNYAGLSTKLFEIKGKIYDTLACANDCEETWPEIANVIEAYPDNFFTKPI